jgi:hypothetical protein
MPKEKTGSYRSYLLRCWQEHPSSEQPPEWRFTLQEVSGAQSQHAFGSFDQLVAFLHSELLGQGKPENNPDTTL